MSPVFWAICAATPYASDIYGLAIGSPRLDFLQLFMKLNAPYEPLFYVTDSSFKYQFFSCYCTCIVASSISFC